MFSGAAAGARPAVKDAVPPGMRPTARAPSAPKPPPSPPVVPPPATAPPANGPELLTTPKPSRAGWTLTVLVGSSKGQVFRIPPGGAAVVGRIRGGLVFGDDVHVSPQHATFLLRDGNMIVRDDGSGSGVFVTLRNEETLPLRAFFCASDRLFRYLGPLEKPKPAPGRVLPYGAPLPAESLYAVEELFVGHRTARSAVSPGPVLSIGQAGCDLSYPQDVGLAPRHCELTVGPTGAVLKDLSAGLGTFIRLTSGVERTVQSGDRIRVGAHVIEVSG
jgi:pSer/pThr/pTyr-binding forkhead associated (FHA) protein